MTSADDALTAPAVTGGAPTTSPDRRFGLGLAAITLVGLVGRVAFTVATKGSDTALFDEGDGFFYGNVARNLAAGHFFVNPFDGRPAADHPPLTVLVLGPASWLFHDSVLAQRLTMTVLGTLVIAAMGLLGRAVAGRGAGLAAAGVAAANPNLWVNDAVLMSESVSALLIVGCLASGFALARRPSLGRAALAGATIGLTVLARAEMGLFLPFMVLPVLVLARSLTWPQRAARLALATVLLGAVVAPWTAWNLAHFDRPVWLSTNDGTTLLGANCPAVYDTGIVGGWSLRCVLDVRVDPTEQSRAAATQRKVAVDYLKAHAGRLPVVLVAREGRTFGFWRPDQSVYINQGEGRPRAVSWACFVAFWAMLPFGALGAIGLRRRRRSLVPAVAALLTVVAVSGLFYGIPRFRLPLDVALCLLVGVAAADLRTRFRTGRGADVLAAPGPGG